ncbi:MAG: YihA family ribosome biogenesis GTP-binding protein [Bacteroidetes bacterium]|nr:YihA family ribosome biogenesis GTP-binding protein [Bacteroidota bacterium]
MKMKAEFKGSYPSIATMPKPDLAEFAFIGRSNVGKSSLINMLCQQKDLAKTSSKPGKTQMVVQFLVENRWFLVDLPGYGYAKISKEKRTIFGELIQDYLIQRETMNCVFVLVDSRLEPQKIDIEFIEWLGVSAIPFAIVFTKTDKLKPKELIDNVANYKAKLLETWEELPDFFITSATHKEGRDELLKFIEKVCKLIDSRV